MNHSMSCEYPEGCSCGASEVNALHAKVMAMRAALNIALSALEDIGTSAHCIAKTGPEIDNVWGKLMGINVKATTAIAEVRAARDGN